MTVFPSLTGALSRYGCCVVRGRENAREAPAVELCSSAHTGPGEAQAMRWNEVARLLRHLQRDHDLDALSEIVRLTQDWLFRMALGVTANREDAGDLVQETYLALVERYDTIRNPEKLRAWLASVLRRKVREQKGPRRLLILDPQSLDEVAPSQGNSQSPLGFLLRQENRREIAQALQEAIDSLTPRERECFTLIQFEGLSAEEVAKRLGLKLSSVKTYHSRARTRLQRHKGLRKWL